MSLADGLKNAANTYRNLADFEEQNAKKGSAGHSWHMGRAGAFRQASLDFAALADISASVEQAK